MYIFRMGKTIKKEKKRRKKSDLGELLRTNVDDLLNNCSS